MCSSTATRLTQLAGSDNGLGWTPTRAPLAFFFHARDDQSSVLSGPPVPYRRYDPTQSPLALFYLVRDNWILVLSDFSSSQCHEVLPG